MGTPLFGADNRLDQDTVILSAAADPDFPGSNLNDDRTYTVYRNNLATAGLNIVTDAGSAVNVDYFMLAGHDLSDPNKDAAGAVKLTFQSSPDDIVYTTIFTVTPSDNKLIARSFLPAVSERFFRIRLTRASAFKVNLGELQWGTGVRAPFGFEVGFDPDAERLRARFNQTHTGNFVGSTVQFTERQADINLRIMPDSFVSDDTSPGGFRDFWNNHARLLKPFLFLWNPGTLATDVTHEPEAFFALVDPGQGIRRPLVTPLDKDFRDVRFRIVGLAE